MPSGGVSRVAQATGRDAFRLCRNRHCFVLQQLPAVIVALRRSADSRSGLPAFRHRCGL